MVLPQPANDNSIDTLLNLDRVKAVTGLSRSTIYRMMDGGTFPRPLQLGPNSVRWRTSHVVEWINGLSQAA